MNSLRTLKHSVGAVTFVVALLTYTLCVQPTVPFWDCGEFTAAAVQQQVPHPPGAPLFLMVGKLFHMLNIGDPAVRVNMVSVVASAATIWLCYLIGIMLIRSLRAKREDDLSSGLLYYGAACVGALAFCWSDTFWFNAVESEVYASSSLFVALVVYLMLRWNEEADTAGHERYLLMIAYLIGLSTGVHLLAVLAIFSIGLLVFFRKYTLSIKSVVVMGLLTLAVFATVYPGIVKYFPALLAGNLPWKNEAHEYYVENSGAVHVMGVLLIIAAIAGAVYGHRARRPLLSLACAGFLSMFLGYTSYTQTLLRANAAPPMNENAPKTFRSLISYLGREQYGDAPMFPRRFERDPDKVEAYKKYGPYTPPPNKHIESIHSPGMSYSVPDYAAVKSSAADWNYMFSYQLDHMFLRYLLWNFFGRTSDVQDAEAWTWTGAAKYLELQNFANGYASHFPINFYGLPFLLGLFGMIQQFRRDWRLAVVMMSMFLVMGVVAAFAQNQQEPQPRERDYFYTGAFMVWCLWIAIGCLELGELAARSVKSSLTKLAVVIVCLLAVPLNMAAQGWFIHSRAGNYVPFDYAYNILQSCEKDAVLVTNGDNDTFPLWCLQDVYGVRRDIRILNMSLASTLWYVYDLKNLEPWGAKKLPLTFDNASLTVDEYSEGALSTKYGPAERVRFALSDAVCREYQISPDSTGRVFDWTATGYARADKSFAYSVSQQVVIDFIKQTKFERPLYFSLTCGYPTSDLYCGLGEYCRMEGMAYRICPRKMGAPGEVVDNAIMSKCLLSLKNDDQYNTNPEYGFKFRNLANKNVYYDETHRRYIDNYRTMFIRFANILLNQGDKAKAVAVLDTMNAVISQDLFPISYALQQDISSIYEGCGARSQSIASAKRVAEQCQTLVDKPYLAAVFRQFTERMPPALTASQAYTVCGEYQKARDLLQRYRIESRDEQGYELRLAKLNADEQEASKNYAEALKIVREYILKMRAANNPQFAEALQVFEAKANELEAKLSSPEVH